jgi:hypothetical protein
LRMALVTRKRSMARMIEIHWSRTLHCVGKRR